MATKLKAGRRYSVDSDGIRDLKRTYIVVQDSTLGTNGETASFTGVPAIGTAHPNHSGLKVASYDVKEGEDNDKKILEVTVNYSTETTETGTPSGSSTELVTEYGWEDGTTDRDLVADAVDGSPIVNSAGEPFESSPRIVAPAPVFVKTVKYKTKKNDWAGCFCCVNSSSVTVGGVTCPACSLLCTVSEKMLFGEAWTYQYTVRLRYRSNPVALNGSGSATDIGWDVAIIDAGLRELKTVSNQSKLVAISVIDKETGKRCEVTKPALLNGQGAALAANGTPYAMRFRSYARVSFPNWFYSAPSS